MKRLTLLTLLVLAITSPASAQVTVTVCYGPDNCAKVEPGGTRQMTAEESRAQARDTVLGDLYRTRRMCPTAADPRRCHELVAALLVQFLR